MKRLLLASLVFGGLLTLLRCSKKDVLAPPVNKTKLGYGDSIFYLKNSVYTISPNDSRQGTYSAYPDNLRIDRITGKITVDVAGTDSNSQTGLWYKIKFRGNSGETDSTNIMISGLTYVDAFYNLAQSDSIIYPIYNADLSKSVPSGQYDMKHDNEIAINPANGQINIKESIRRGLFKRQSGASEWKQATIEYSINDKSNGARNGIQMVIYYYHSMDDVPSNVSQLMQAHQTMTLGLRTAPIPSTKGDVDTNLPKNLSLSKPRPPCVVIVGI